MPTLQWLTRDIDVQAVSHTSYRLLEEAPDLSSGGLDVGNMLIQGDNLEALKALLPFYSSQVKCVYIDPPFNTGQAFQHYDDNIEHSIWLRLMFPRLELLRDFLAPTGTIVVHLDDEELAYCIVILDEIFGRKNRINICTFRQGAAVGHKAINPGVVTVTNYIVIYARDKANGWKPNRVFTKRERDARYSSFIENVEEDYPNWRLTPLSQAFAKKTGETLRKKKSRLGDQYESALDNFVLKNANRVVQPVPPAYDSVGEETRNMIDKSRENPNRVYLQVRQGYQDIYMCNGKRWLFYRDKLKKIDGELVSGEPLTNLWDDLLSNNLHNEGGVTFPKGKKPEALIKRVMELFTTPGDLVLDSFLGSGTAAAVAHKMGRRYIGIEMGEHAVTHCVPRLNKVIEGEQGGISKSVGWKGGGGFRFYRLGPPVFDAEGQIRSDITFPVLAAHVYFSETGRPMPVDDKSPFLGIHDGRAYVLLYNGVLGDRHPSNGNVLTRPTLAEIRSEIARREADFAGPLTVYGEQSRLSATTLAQQDIVFKQTPYDIKARA